MGAVPGLLFSGIKTPTTGKRRKLWQKICRNIRNNSIYGLISLNRKKISGYNNGNRRKSVIQPFIFKMDLPGGPDRNVRRFVFYTGINISGHGTCAFPHRIQKEIL